MIDRTIIFNNYLGASFPNFAGKDASGAGAVDGTEWLAAFVDNWAWWGGIEEYAKFIAHKNEKLGSAGKLDEVRQLVS